MTEPNLGDGDAEDEFSELFDASIPRVDLVGKGANGLPFLIAKAEQGGAFPADVVRGLVAKAKADGQHNRDAVTITGSPSAVMKMIHEAAQRARADESEGAMSEEQVAKADVPDSDEPLPDADEVASGEGLTPADGDPDDPASAAWEAVDAVRAQQGIDLAIALRRLLEQAQSREAQEASSPNADSDDVENVWCLDDALIAVDCIVSILAPFAVCEEAEAADRQAERDALVGKGMVRKAGRVLSSTNESRIRQAEGLLQEVLASLPAPDTSGGDEPVAKSDTKEADVAADAGTITVDVVPVVDQEALAKASEEIEKAKGDPQVAVYTADGKLVGTVDQADLNPIAAPAAPEGGDEQSADSSDDTSADDSADDAAAPDAPDEATIPGTDTVAAPAPTPTEDDTVTKAAQVALSAALTEALTPIAEQLSQHAELATMVKGLQERVEHLATLPDDRKSPLLNGSGGTAAMPSRGGERADALVDLRKAVEEAANPVAKAEAQQKLAYASVRDRFAR